MRASSINPTRWPGGVQAVVTVTIHVDGPSVQAGKGLNALGIHGVGRYAIRRGVPRYLEILKRHRVRATFFCCGHDVECYPQLFRDIHAAGHEIAAHGYQHEGWDLGEQEPHLLEKTHHIIAEAVGVPPVGWCSPSGRKSPLTLPTLQRLGYRYDSSEKDFDLPYIAAPFGQSGSDFIILPNNTVSLDDYPMYKNGLALAEEVLDNWISEFETMRAEEGYVHLSVHPIAGHGSGTPARAAVVDRFLAHVLAIPDVAVVTLRDLADHCLANADVWRLARP